MKLRLYLTAILFAISLGKGSVKAQSIVNGSFEDTPAGYSTGSYTWARSSTDPTMVITDFNNWTITRNQYTNNWDPNINGQPRATAILDFEQNPYQTQNAYDGSRFLSTYDEGIADKTTVDAATLATGLTAGLTYRVTFAYSAMFDNTSANYADTGIWTLNAGSQSLSVNAIANPDFKTNADTPLILPGFTYIQSPWRTASLEFVAGSDTQVLDFIGVAQGGPNQLFLDNVTIAVVPEPAGSALIGVTGLLCLLRRRRPRCIA